MILSFVAAVLISTMMARLSSSASVSGDLVRRRRAFYATDGLVRMTIQDIKNYMEKNADPSTSDLQNPENIPPPSIPGYALEHFELESLDSAWEGPVGSGAFAGMNALHKPIGIHLKARETFTDAAAELHVVATIAQISLFQFFVFSDGYLDIYPGPNMLLDSGRIHANGDLCFGSNADLRLMRLTSAGRLLASDDRCRRNAGNGARIWNGTSHIRMDASNDHGCTDCEGTGLDWSDYALQTWQDNALDAAHAVSPLTLPVPELPDVQAGLDAAGAPKSNEHSARVLVDPVQEGESDEIRSQRLAFKADLRILNGVWYINDGTWPGLPIWSDHPGSFTTQNEEGIEGSPQMVGQDDLRSARGWGNTPRRFSYYAYDPTTLSLFEGGDAVLSYGAISPKSGGGHQVAFWAKGADAATYTDIDGTQKAYFCNACGDAPCASNLTLRAASTSYCQVTLHGQYPSSLSAQYLKGTTSGFLDYRVQTTASSQGAILPINLDLEQLALAMSDTTPGELGSYFGGGEDFNGILYISSTWEGSMEGIPGGLALLWPSEGSRNDVLQAKSLENGVSQRALPFPLCSESLGYIPNQQRVGFSGPPSDGDPSNGFEPIFTIPSCDPSISPTSRPSALRLINGATLDQNVFPWGLSIVSNLPIYVTGPMNTNSDTSSGTATPWVPMMVAGDAVSLLSGNWSDAGAPWDGSGSFSARTAVNTVWNIEMISGHVETVDASHYSGGLENFPRFLENWSGKTATITGALILGYAAVYQRQPWHYGSPIYTAPTRNWSFDAHLKTQSFQPPGAPRFSLHSASYVSEEVFQDE